MKKESAKPRAPRRRAPAAPREWTAEQKQQIAEMAYHRFLARGGEHGYELEDWVEAESEFAASLKKPRARRATRAAKA
ncbi:MAG: DUF2934 domain-containing protein [Acidobacteria bacterium]|nr:DUF2934 domain-containing protein [Acidobacteriota bacterium]